MTSLGVQHNAETNKISYMMVHQNGHKKNYIQNGCITEILKKKLSITTIFFLAFYVGVTFLIDKEKIATGGSLSRQLSEIEVVNRSFGSTSNHQEHDEFTFSGTKTLSLVISHCDHTLEWMGNYFGSSKYKISEITVISKCDKKVEGLDIIKNIAPVALIRQPNVGRCDHSYARWIHERIKLSKESLTEENVVLFLKDNNYLLQYSRSIEEVLDSTVAVGFGCFLGPRCWVCENNLLDGNTPLTIHDKEIVDDFRMSEYNHFDRDQSDDFPSEFPNLKAWVDYIGLLLPGVEAIPVCYGGAFAVKERQFSKQPIEVWSKMEAGLSRANNIEEGHFAERMWAAILTDDSSMMTVSKAMVPFVTKKIERGGLQGSRTDGLMFVPLHGTYGSAKFNESATI